MTSAFVFPGQGSQSVGMLDNLAENFNQVKETFDEASDVLNYDLWGVVAQGSIEELNQTHITQPAMLAAGMAVWRIWRAELDFQPSYFAGHSLGEYTALAAAGAVDFATAIALVEKRGQLMQKAVPHGEGAMAAVIGLEDQVVIQICQDASDIGVVEAVNFNALGQVVIAGSVEAIDKAIELAKEQGARKAVKLPVSVPSHCSLMKPAADELAEILATIQFEMPSIPVIHNTNVSVAEDADQIKQLLIQQLYNPVRWVETIQYFAQHNISYIIECGPGKVLASLNKRIDKSLKTFPVFDKATLQKVEQALGENA